MSKLDFKKYNPAQQALLCDIIERENLLRLRWFQKHQDVVQRTATLHNKPKNYLETDVGKQHMIACLPALTKAHASAARHRFQKTIDPESVESKTKKHGHSIPEVGLGDPVEYLRLARPETDTRPDPIMRPVEAKVRNLLYKPEFGKKQYLEKRLGLNPEDKYYFPETTNCDYGWRLKDSTMKREPGFGMINHMSRALLSRVGPSADPVYYRQPELDAYRKC